MHKTTKWIKSSQTIQQANNSIINECEMRIFFLYLFFDSKQTKSSRDNWLDSIEWIVGQVQALLHDFQSVDVIIVNERASFVDSERVKNKTSP